MEHIALSKFHQLYQGQTIGQQVTIHYPNQQIHGYNSGATMPMNTNFPAQQRSLVEPGFIPHMSPETEKNAEAPVDDKLDKNNDMQ
jgi:hypothetical protein